MSEDCEKCNKEKARQSYIDSQLNGSATDVGGCATCTHCSVQPSHEPCRECMETSDSLSNWYPKWEKHP